MERYNRRDDRETRLPAGRRSLRRTNGQDCPDHRTAGEEKNDREDDAERAGGNDGEVSTAYGERKDEAAGKEKGG